MLDQAREASALQRLEVLDLLQQLGEGLAQGLSFYRHRLFIIVQVVGEVDFTERTLPNLLDEAELLAHQRAFDRHLN